MQQTFRFSIVTEQAVDDVQSTSVQNPSNIYTIFKHSTRCNISSMALNRMEKTDFFESARIPFYYLDLIQFRNISNYIAEKFQVQHESPQILLIQNGKCFAHTSHNDINTSWLKENIAL